MLYLLPTFLVGNPYVLFSLHLPLLLGEGLDPTWSIYGVPFYRDVFLKVSNDLGVG